MLFTFRIGISSDRLASRVADFLLYEARHGRRVILSARCCGDAFAFVRCAAESIPAEGVVRKDDPQWVVHSTTEEAWAAIRESGRLKSLAVLREEGREVLGLGEAELGDPKDYADYVMLGRIDQINAEHVVASRAAGMVVTEPDRPYPPGVRLYFDNHAIIRDGLAVRDGLHTTKVYRELPLVPYLVAKVAADEFPAREWTPRGFWQAANERFASLPVAK